MRTHKLREVLEMIGQKGEQVLNGGDKRVRVGEGDPPERGRRHLGRGLRTWGRFIHWSHQGGDPSLSCHTLLVPNRVLGPGRPLKGSCADETQVVLFPL